MGICCDDVNDKGCCCCCGSHIGVWIFGVLYALGFLSGVGDLIYQSQAPNMSSEIMSPIMWENSKEGPRYEWRDMTEEQTMALTDLQMYQQQGKVTNAVGMGILCVPFLVVLVMPKSVGSRLCLFVMMLINLILDVIGYITVVIGALMWSGWFATQAMERSQAPYTDIGRYTAPADYNNQLVFALNAWAGGAMVWAYSAMGIFIFWLAIECLIMSVYYKFYTTGRDTIKG